MAGAKSTIGATIASRRSLPLAVAPTDDGTSSNTIRRALAPVACFNVGAPGFDFDSSLILPAMREELVALGKLLQKVPDHPITIFGHADTTGSDDYNKELAGRRALSFYALLTRQPALWERLYSRPTSAPGDRWTQKQLLLMLGQFFSPVTGEPYFTGKPTTQKTAEVEAAIKAFQQDHGLADDGDAGPKTREKLFELYMELLTETADRAADQTIKVVIDKERFLGQGGDPDGKADYQSCSEFNPAVILSKDELAALTPEDRDAENAANRRVTMYFFEKQTRVALEEWPCPTITESTAKCRKRFWSDGERRRSPAEVRRTFDESQDTFACRFYHRLAGGSPCERPTSLTFLLEIFFDLPSGQQPLPQSYTLASTDLVFQQTLDATATIRLNDRTAVLAFEAVRPRKAYSLSYALADGSSIPIFVGVPFDSIDDFGDDTEAPPALVLADEPTEEPPLNQQSEHPLLAFNEADVAVDSSLVERDPNAALA